MAGKTPALFLTPRLRFQQRSLQLMHPPAQVTRMSRRPQHLLDAVTLTCSVTSVASGVTLPLGALKSSVTDVSRRGTASNTASSGTSETAPGLCQSRRDHVRHRLCQISSGWQTLRATGVGSTGIASGTAPSQIQEVLLSASTANSMVTWRLFAQTPGRYPGLSRSCPFLQRLLRSLCQGGMLTPSVTPRQPLPLRLALQTRMSCEASLAGEALANSSLRAAAPPCHSLGLSSKLYRNRPALLLLHFPALHLASTPQTLKQMDRRACSLVCEILLSKSHQAAALVLCMQSLVMKAVKADS